MAILVAVTGLSVAAAGSAPAANAAPFDPIEPTIFIAQGVPSQLSAATQNDDGFSFTPVGAASSTYNALGYNLADNYLYGISEDRRLVRIEDDGAVSARSGVLPGLSGLVNVGAFIAPNHLAVANSGGSTMWVIDVTTNSVISTTSLSGVLRTSDWQFAEGYLWGIRDSAARVTRVDPNTGQISLFPTPAGVPGTSSYGGAWAYGNGNLGFSNNNTGTIYQLAITDASAGTTSLVSSVAGPPSGRNDGAAAPGLPADLSVTKEVAASDLANGRVSYTITVTNNGAGVSSGWTVSDSLPDGVSNPEVSDGFASSVSGSTITVSGGRLDVTQSASFTITADAEVAPGECVTNVASVLGNEEDPDESNNVDSAQACRPGLAITKTSSAAANAKVGDLVEYTVTLTNTGVVDYTTTYPSSFSDDLSNVLDDATFNDDAAVSFSDGTTGTAPTFTGNNLEWSGALKAGETAAFTYSVTLTNTGDGSVVNTACVPEELSSEDINCASTTAGLPKLTIAKTSDTTELPTNGGTVTYQVTVTNQGPGDATADNRASFEDDLSKVLDDGDFVDGSLTATSGTAERDGNTLSWSGALVAGESVTLTYEVTYDANKGGNNQLLNVACLPVEIAQDPENPCRQVQIPGAALQQWKTADPTSGNVATGDQITYTLHFLNTGRAAATVNNSDDLSSVLDDADLTAGPTSSNADLTAVLNGNTIEVSGSVAPGREYTVTYTVQVRAEADRGDNTITNALTQCETNDTELCAPVEHRIPHMTVEKSSDVATARTGGTVTYQVKVTNDGTGAFTTKNPATFTDDLTDVLEDAVYNEDAHATTGTVSYSAPTLSWEGALAPGDSATVTYTVTVTNAGNHQLVNTACAPNAGEQPSCDTDTVLMPHFLISKSVDPATGSKVDASQVITYTLSFGNDGTAPGDIDYTDNLSDVLDDAAFGDGPSVSDATLTAVRDAELIGVTGSLAVGQTVTVTYNVTVNPDGQRGNNQLANVLADTDSPNPTCMDDGVECTENPIGELATFKTVDPASGTTLRTGDTATYTLHFENTGKADVAVNREDVLAGVLDDADVTTEPTVSNDALSASAITDGRFTVTGTLAAGAKATVTYTVTVKADGARGDDRLGNFLVPPGAEPPAECVAGEQPNCTVNPVSDATVAKSADPESGAKVNAGQDVTYTLTFTNRSKDAGSAPAVVDYTDNMKDVLDDAILTEGPTVSNTDLSAAAKGNTIRITGEVPYGAVYTVSYTVKVKAYPEQGNHQLGNVVAVTGENPVCAPDSPLCTNHQAAPPTQGLTVTGSVMITSAALWPTLVLLLTGSAALFVARRRGLAAQAQMEAARNLIE